MSEAYPKQGDAMVEKLLPKILANHVSKLPDFEDLKYGAILSMVGNSELPLQDRLYRVAGSVGRTALTDSLIHEATILTLCATGQEADVLDEDRQRSYKRSDVNQMRDAASEKTLDHYLEQGIEVVFDNDAREAARRYCDLDERDVPLIEKLKAKRLVTINGFDDSRVMYAVHDLIDHAWLFDQMRDTGLMERYDDFLSSIEMGSDAFLYGRQAELLASVGFGSRRWQVAETQGEELLLDRIDVDGILGSLDDPRTYNARKMLAMMSPQRRQQAIFMIENMAVQFADERRRWGAVKRPDGHGGRRPMDLFDPLHVALMIETLGMLQDSDTHGNVQLAATLEVNSMLEAAVCDTSVSSGKLYIPVPRLRPGDMVKLDNSNNNDVDWINRHLSVSTSYNRIG